jgi:ParB-like chromosome segregation protein Spo0J
VLFRSHENLEREDVSAIEEAEGFLRLIEEYGASVPTLIADTGKSRSYIYGRIKLNSLCPEVKAAVSEQGLPADVAIKIARLPTSKAQREALEDVRAYGDEEGWMSQREALETLSEATYFIPIAKARFNPEDAHLTSVGPCTTCQHLSTNTDEPEAFGAVTCSNVECFQA